MVERPSPAGAVTAHSPVVGFCRFQEMPGHGALRRCARRCSWHDRVDTCYRRRAEQPSDQSADLIRHCASAAARRRSFFPGNCSRQKNATGSRYLQRDARISRNASSLYWWRNWLSLEPGDAGRIWANWYVENEPYPFTKVIHPIDFRMPAPIVPRRSEPATSVMGIGE